MVWKGWEPRGHPGHRHPRARPMTTSSLWHTPKAVCATPDTMGNILRRVRAIWPTIGAEMLTREANKTRFVALSTVEARRGWLRKGGSHRRIGPAMRRPTAVSPESLTLSQALARGLRASFDDAVSSPLPEHLAALLRRLTSGLDGAPSEAWDHGASATETSSIPDR